LRFLIKKGCVINPLIAACMAFLSFAAMDGKSLYDQGFEAFRTGNYGSAELLFRKIVDSGDVEYLDRAWFYLARSIYNKNKYESALFEFKSFLNRCTTENLATESRYWMGESYYNLADYPNAIEEFRRYITKSKDGEFVPAAHDRIGAVYIAQKRFDEAVIEWEAARSRSSDQQKNALRQYWAGEALFKAGKHDEAIVKLSPLASAAADSKIAAMSNMLLGRIYQKKGEHQRALQMFNAIPAALMKENPFAEAQFFKARSHIRLGQRAQARTILDAYIADGKKSRWYYNALLEMGGILIQGPDHGEGTRLLNLVMNESNKPSLKSRASILLGQYYADSMPEKSIPYLEESLKTAGADKRKSLLLLLGKTCLRVKDYTKALDTFNIYVKENPFDANLDEVNFLRARAYLERGEIERATEIFETIRKENPFSKFNSESNFYLALVRYKKGDTAGAINLLRDYLKRKKTDQGYEANLLLLRIYLGKEDLEGAGRIADSLAREYLNRKDVETALYDYTSSLMRKGHDARRFINLIINRFPASESAAELCHDLGNENFKRKNFVYALEYYDKYLKTPFTRNQGNAYYRKIVSLHNLKRHDELIGIVLQGNFPAMSEAQWKEIVLLQARSYYQLKKFDDVFMTLDIHNLPDYPKEDVLMYIRCALQVGDYRSAMEANDFLEKDKPIYSESLYIIGEFLRENGKREEADLFFSKIINECPGTRFVSHAKLSQSEIHIMNKKFGDALNLLSEVDAGGDKDVQNRKNYLLIRCYFDMDMDAKAVSYAEEHLPEILGSGHGEQMVKDMLKYYLKKKDLQQFERYVKFLARYPGNEPYAQYLSGKIYFQTGNYYKSYNYFYALSQVKSAYTDESLYFLGMYSMLVARNAAGALAYFNRLIELEEANIALKEKGMIQNAILYREMNNNEKARELLKKILSSSAHGMSYIQASNLYHEFGYDTK
jgi:TolA-binding protein